MLKNYYKILLFIVFFIVSSDIMARPPKPPHPLPVDGGILVLAILGVGYAIKKIKDNK